MPRRGTNAKHAPQGNKREARPAGEQTTSRIAHETFSAVSEAMGYPPSKRLFWRVFRGTPGNPQKGGFWGGPAPGPRGGKFRDFPGAREISPGAPRGEKSAHFWAFFCLPYHIYRRTGPPRETPRESGGAPGGEKSVHFCGYLITLPVGTKWSTFFGNFRPPRGLSGTPVLGGFWGVGAYMP